MQNTINNDSTDSGNAIASFVSCGVGPSDRTPPACDTRGHGVLERFDPDMPLDENQVYGLEPGICFWYCPACCDELAARLAEQTPEDIKWHMMTADLPSILPYLVERSGGESA